MQIVLDDFDLKVTVDVTYPRKHKTVELGNKVKPKAVKHAPDLYIQPLPSKTTAGHASYVVALTDPDATSQAEPVKAQMCHWIVANVTGDWMDLEERYMGPDMKVLAGLEQQNPWQEVMSYFPPAPPPKTGYHRYVFVLLGAYGGTVDKVTQPKERSHWGYGKVGAGVREWAAENNLEVLGRLIGIHILLAAADCKEKGRTSSLHKTRSRNRKTLQISERM